jgi:hypothetical protein
VHGAETCTFQKVSNKYLERFEMWHWRMMGKIRWTDHVAKEELLCTGKSRGISNIY